MNLGSPLLATLLSLCTPLAAASVRYVDPAATGANDGSSWVDAHTSLRAALDSAQPGDELWVVGGTYLPGPTATLADTFRLRSGIALYGGFAGTETLRSQRDWVAHETVLSGDVNQDDVFGFPVWWQGWNIVTANSAQVVTGSGADETAVLDGFTIAQGSTGPTGTPAGAPEMYGGGLVVESGSPTIRNCRFWRNLAAFAHGGAIYSWNASPLVEACDFVENWVHLGNGAGIYAGGAGTPRIRDCSFTANTATGGTGGGQGEGCAISLRQTAPLSIERCRFTGNVSRQFYSGGGSLPTYGGALMAFLTQVVVRDCEFRNNSADIGGAISLWSTSTVVDCLFTGNTAYGSNGPGGGTLGGVGAAIDHISYVADDVRVVNCSFANNRAGESTLESYGPSPVRVENCVLWGNTSTDPTISTRSAQVHGPVSLRSSCVQGLFQNVPGETTPDPAQVPGCIDANPLVAYLAGGDLHLTSGSPCIDAGDGTLVPLGTATDLDGNLRVVRGLPGSGPALVDMGAYEFGSAPPGPCPVVVLQPADAAIAAGATVVFTVTAAGDAPLAYQWRRNGTALLDGGNVSGSTSNALTIAAVTNSDAGSYDVVVSNGCGPVTSAAAILTIVLPPNIVRLCFGDGSGTACPCGNTSQPGDQAGCLNSLGNGGTLDHGGRASIANDSLQFDAQDMPNSSALFFQGTARIAGGAGAAFGDGLRCAGGTVIRLATKTNVAGQSQYPEAGDAPVSVRGACTAGDVRLYQVWYRNADPAFCTPATFNLTNSVEATWGL